VLVKEFILSSGAEGRNEARLRRSLKVIEKSEGCLEMVAFGRNSTLRTLTTYKK